MTIISDGCQLIQCADEVKNSGPQDEPLERDAGQRIGMWALEPRCL